MSYRDLLTIEFAGIVIRFSFPTGIKIPSLFFEFLCDDVTPDAEYKIQPLERPLDIKGEAIAIYNGIEIFRCDEGQLRIYSSLKEEDGCQVACFLSKNRKNILYYPNSRWDYYSKQFHCLHLVGIENLLIEYDAFLLHSSVVKINRQTVLFSGPSGIGKSTQASLWEKYLGAVVLNGDRCIVRKIEDRFHGCGSPWCGTSGIYKKEHAPIRGIFVLRQSMENNIRRVGAEAFVKLFQQSIVNTWDSEFLVKLTDLIAELLEQVPVYELSCRPDEEAVQLAYNTLFKKEELL